MSTVLPVIVTSDLSELASVFAASPGLVILDGNFQGAFPVYTSSNGVTWQTVGIYPSLLNEILMVGLMGSSYIMVGLASDFVTYYIAVSGTGSSWAQTDITNPITSGDVILGPSLSTATTGGVMYVLSYAGPGGLEAWLTTTGTGTEFSSSIKTDLPATGCFRRLISLFGNFYAIPFKGVTATERVYVSSNAINWTALGPVWGAKPARSGIGFLGSKVYSCGGLSSNAVYSTTDFLTWNLEIYTNTWSARTAPAVQNSSASLLVLGGDVGSQEIWQVQAGSTPPTGIPL